MHRVAWIVPAVALTLTACSVAPATSQRGAVAPERAASTPAAAPRPATPPATGAPATTQAPAAAAADATVPPKLPHSRRGGPGRFAPNRPRRADRKNRPGGPRA
jgi:hypothetical protein